MALECCFCDNNFYKKQKEIINLKMEDLILYENEMVYVITDLAPLIKGHILIVSKKHFKCYADSNDDVINALDDALSYMLKSKIYEEKYIFFEHGSMGYKEAGSCIEHAHLHLLPISIDINNVFNYFNNIHIESIYIKDINKNNKSYLLLGGKNMDIQKIYADFIPSQFMRMLITSSINRYRWSDAFKTKRSIDIFKQTLCVLK